ncbi:hypothetical protein NKR23_g4216 [Pleurostoma richardsiae]|jgi:HSP20 family molecular chaperone IbpA|uniref:SHSP domain-containing protein n=1 Tax=Pleurostoma richardsiae TaxID=41990 RepID=A0AA38VG05_9PEZI|nr:hypothetical protein NKR23_g4216 [Pleurostoma richardsiae]
MSAYFTTHHFSPRFTSPRQHENHEGEHQPVTAITAPAPPAVEAGRASLEQQQPPPPHLPAQPAAHHGGGLDALARFLHAFNTHYGGGPGGGGGAHDVVHPHFDLVETGTSYAIYGELPGLEREDVNVEVNDTLFTVTVSGVLQRPVPPGASGAEEKGKEDGVGVVHKDAVTAAGEQPAAATPEAPAAEGAEVKKEEDAAAPPPAELHWHVTERRVGQFRRAFQFPIGLVEMGAVKASMRAGLLTIAVPKKAGGDGEEARRRLAAARKLEVVESGVEGQVLGTVNP